MEPDTVLNRTWLLTEQNEVPTPLQMQHLHVHLQYSSNSALLVAASHLNRLVDFWHFRFPDGACRMYNKRWLVGL